MVDQNACEECLRRSWLLGLLGPYIEKNASEADGQLSPELLIFANEALAEAAAPAVAAQLIERVAALDQNYFQSELAASGCWARCRHSDLYPSGLRDARDAPWALIGKGNAELLDGLGTDRAVAIVGSRRGTSYGREVGRSLGRELAAAEIVVVGGLAFGVAASAHRGALEAGQTIAVLPCGPDTPYPAVHRSLWRQITEKGLAISELPPGAAAWRWTVQARNRIVVALAGMTVAVEAAAHSGTLRMADLAADLGRDVGAVPGPVTARASTGTNGLLAGGSCVIRDAQDVLDAMLGPEAEPVPPLAQDLALVLGAVESGAGSLEAIASTLSLTRAAAAAALNRLEVLGFVARSPVGSYSMASLGPAG